MITKGEIVKRGSADNLYVVRTAKYDMFAEVKGSTPDFGLFEASCCIMPGYSNVYEVGDIVWIDFEDGKQYQPVITGKLLLPDSSQVNSTVKSLEVKEFARLPASTSIGTINPTQLSTLTGARANIQAQIDSIDRYVKEEIGSIQDGAGLSNSNPLMDGAASPGNGVLGSRWNHIHPTDTTRAAANNVVTLTGDQLVGGLKTFGTVNITGRINDLHLPTGSGTIALVSQIPSLAGYATEQWVNNQGFLKNLSGRNISELTNDTGFITNSALSGVLRNTDVVDNLTSSSAVLPLSANQGRVLYEIVSTLEIGGQNRGAFDTYADLIAAVPTPNVNDHAIVRQDENNGDTPWRYDAIDDGSGSFVWEATIPLQTDGRDFYLSPITSGELGDNQVNQQHLNDSIYVKYLYDFNGNPVTSVWTGSAAEYQYLVDNDEIDDRRLYHVIDEGEVFDPSELVKNDDGHATTSSIISYVNTQNSYKIDQSKITQTLVDSSDLVPSSSAVYQYWQDISNLSERMDYFTGLLENFFNRPFGSEGTDPGQPAGTTSVSFLNDLRFVSGYSVGTGWGAAGANRASHFGQYIRINNGNILRLSPNAPSGVGMFLGLFNTNFASIGSAQWTSSFSATQTGLGYVILAFRRNAGGTQDFTPQEISEMNTWLEWA